MKYLGNNEYSMVTSDKAQIMKWVVEKHEGGEVSKDICNLRRSDFIPEVMGVSYMLIKMQPVKPVSSGTLAIGIWMYVIKLKLNKIG